MMKILNSQMEDVDHILDLYQSATALQKSKSVVAWPIFERALVEKEVRESRQWKIVIDNVTACVWATTDSDPDIWGDKNQASAIYIHRISTHPDFRGQQLVKEIVNWSKDFARKNNKDFVRMDTVGENIGLINYYKKCGFEFLGLSTLVNTSRLPAHYHNASVSLFQLNVID